MSLPRDGALPLLPSATEPSSERVVSTARNASRMLELGGPHPGSIGGDGQPARRRDPRLAQASSRWFDATTVSNRHQPRPRPYDRDHHPESPGRPAFHGELAVDPCLLGRLLGRALVKARVEIAALVGGRCDGGLGGPGLELCQLPTVEQEARFAIGFYPSCCRGSEATAHPHVITGLIDPPAEAGPGAQERFVRDLDRGLMRTGVPVE